MRRGRTVVLATRNEHKIREFREMLVPLGWQPLSVKDFSAAPEVEEDGRTFVENARKKAETIANVLGLPAIADDSGLCVDALGGRPGVYSARYAGPGATDEENNRKLLAELKGIPFAERTARYRCALAFAGPGMETLIAEGTCEGLVAAEPKGGHGFGYDPLFYVPEYGLTMAQLDPAVKNRISHRAQALRKLQELLRTHVFD
ncbi:XTP/dITP diphosphatase [Bacillaceae bacterium]